MRKGIPEVFILPEPVGVASVRGSGKANLVRFGRTDFAAISLSNHLRRMETIGE